MTVMGNHCVCLNYMYTGKEGEGKQYVGIFWEVMLSCRSCGSGIVQGLGTTNGAERISALTFSYQRMCSKYAITCNKVMLSF